MRTKAVHSISASTGQAVRAEQVSDIISRTCTPQDYAGKRVLLVVPDGTRTAPVGLLFQTLYRCIGEVTKSFDVMIALGTHQPMNEAAISERLDISEKQRKETYKEVRFFNHAWNNP